MPVQYPRYLLQFPDKPVYSIRRCGVDFSLLFPADDPPVEPATWDAGDMAVVSHSIIGFVATAILSGGVAGTTYDVKVQVSTAGGLREEVVVQMLVV